jgi:predicted RNA-binding protein with PUA-like domain
MYWLAKSEPSVYSIDQLQTEKTTRWDGIRNYAARLHLRAMKKGDEVLFYHSNEKTIVGIAKVAKEAYPDPTAKEGDWSAIDLSFVRKLSNPVTLDMIKKDKSLSQMALVRIGRLSVQPVTEKEWNAIVKMANG